MTLLSIQHLSISFGSTQVVRDVSLAVNRGEIVALVGESGSGKSLTAQSLLQLLPGNARVSGAASFSPSLRGADRPNSLADNRNSIDLYSLSPSAIETVRGSRIGMVFQEPMSALNPLHRIARQIIEPYCHHHRLTLKDPRAQARLAELYQAVGLDHIAGIGERYPHQLSGGERQRAMIAMAIANDPDLLIADEPTTALDVALQHRILMLLQSLQRTRQMGMLFITHDLLAVREIADRVVVMRNGEIVEQNTTEALFSHPQHDYTKMLIDAAPSGTPKPIAPTAQPLLACENLSVRFPVKSPILRRTLGCTTAVEHVSIALHAGETLGIVGESGSGKSTLAYALLRLVNSEGPIVFLGNRIDTLSLAQFRPHRRNMQLVFQDPYGSLNPRMTVAEIVAEGLQVHGIQTPSPLAGEGQRSASADLAVQQILQQVGLDPAIRFRYPHEFSGGQRQRIAIARAMILKPKLVVLDEPTSALDMSVQRQVLELLRDLQETLGVAYLFISHDLRVIRAVSHQVLVLRRGQVIEQGSAERLFTATSDPYTQSLLVTQRVPA